MWTLGLDSLQLNKLLNKPISIFVKVFLILLYFTQVGIISIKTSIYNTIQNYLNLLHRGHNVETDIGHDDTGQLLGSEREHIPAHHHQGGWGVRVHVLPVMEDGTADHDEHPAHLRRFHHLRLLL